MAVAHGKVSIYNFSNLNKIMDIPVMELNSVMDVRFNEPGTRLIAGQHDGKVFKIDLT